MVNRYKKSSSELFVFRLMQQVNKMRSELHEHRYYLEQNVAQRTEDLTKRIGVLETCNAALCSKLVSSQKALGTFQHDRILSYTEPRDNTLHLVNARTESPLQKHG